MCRERDESVAEEFLRRDACARQQGRILRIRRNLRHDLVVASQISRDEPEGDRPETEEQHRLQRVHPSDSAHPSEKDVKHDHDRDNRAPKPIGHPAITQAGEGVPAAHHPDDHVGDHHQRGDRENDGTDAITLPTIPEILHLRQVAVLFPEGPEPGADQEDGEGNDETRRRGHQSINPDATLVSQTRTAENREGRHVRAKDGEEENPGTEGPARNEEVLLRSGAFTKGEHPHIEDDREVDENDDGGNHGLWFVSGWSSGSSCSR